MVGGPALATRRLLAATGVSLIAFFFFNDTATTEIYTLSLHDALPICTIASFGRQVKRTVLRAATSAGEPATRIDRKSTRLNSSHSQISYAVFCLKKKKKMSVEYK